LNGISISNAGSLQSINEHSASNVNQTDQQAINTNDQEQSDIMIINTVPSEVY
jgi:hypothetical protein